MSTVHGTLVLAAQGAARHLWRQCPGCLARELARPRETVAAAGYGAHRPEGIPGSTADDRREADVNGIQRSSGGIGRPCVVGPGRVGR